MSQPDPIRVFCGGDRSQQLPFRVLAHSIARHTARTVEIRTIDNALAPIPDDPRHKPYTEFSFARFAIPALCDYQGRAIYMDSDMLVFADIGELWDTDMEGAAIAIERGGRDVADRGKHAAVMLLDCSRLDWKVDEIVAGLGTKYAYKALMQIDPLLQPGQMRELVEPGWNDLDHYQAGRTRNLHFTKIRTQPWVHAAHPDGRLWVDELRLMLAGGAVDAGQLQEEVALGFLRPSLLVELGLEGEGAAPVGDQKLLQAYDEAAGFVAHRALQARFAARKEAIARADCDDRSARRPWLAWWYRLRYRWRTRAQPSRPSSA
jgi:hypothetical protein